MINGLFSNGEIIGGNMESGLMGGNLIRNKPSTNVFEPINILKSLIQGLQPALWLDANDATTITLESGAVSEWRDKSGNNRHATQTTANNRPLLVANGLNDTDVIRFDGSNDFLNVPEVSSSSSDYSIFLVLNPLDNGDTYNYIWDTGSPRIILALVSADSSNQIGFFTETTWKTAETGMIYDAQILSYSVSSSYNFYRNGQNIGSGTGYTPQSFPVSKLGTRYSSNGFLYKNDISQIIIFPRVLTQAERELVEGYLAQSTGLTGNLPDGHPYK